MKILLTGASGFIGGYLARAWKGEPFDVVATSRGSTELPGVLQGDLAEGVPLDEPVDAIVHVAGQSPAPGVTVDDYVRSNVVAMRHLLKYARRYNVTKFIFLSSISVYGDVTVSVVDEHVPVNNPAVYGLTKYLGELLLADEGRLSSIALRLPGVLGAGAKTPWLARVVRQLLQGEPVTIYNPEAPFNNLVHVSDLERFIRHLLHKGWEGFEVATLGCRNPLSVREVVHFLKSRLESTSLVVEGSPRRPSFTISSDRAAGLGYLVPEARVVLESFCAEHRVDEACR